MKNILTAIMIVIPFLTFSQISIIEDVQKKEEQSELCPYDSMSNLIEQRGNDCGYRHLIGQTMMYCGDPWNDRYDSPNIPVGDYYLVKDVKVTNLSSINKKYSVFVVENTRNHQQYSFDYYVGNYNGYWAVVGYYEKQKNLLVGKELVYRTIPGDKNVFDYIYNYDTDTITRGIKDGSVWKCVDISVKFRTSDKWKWESSRDYRCPIVLVLENPDYGKHYCYLEDKFGSHYSITNYVFSSSNNGLPLLCGKFVDKIAYDNVVAANAKTKAERLAVLTRKYGSTNAKLIADGYIKIGMTKQMCRDAWGEPDNINTTITSNGTSEQWCYGYSYVYFEGNKITAIQN